MHGRNIKEFAELRPQSLPIIQDAETITNCRLEAYVK